MQQIKQFFGTHSHCLSDEPSEGDETVFDFGFCVARFSADGN
jgi:hypothetical protein